MYYIFWVSTSHIFYIYRIFSPCFLLKKQILHSAITIERFTKAKLPHIFRQNSLESCDINHLFRITVQFSFKTVALFLDKHKNTPFPPPRYFSYSLLHRIARFVPRSRISTLVFHFFCCASARSALQQWTPLPFSAALRNAPSLLRSPKTPHFRRNSAVKTARPALATTCPASTCALSRRFL